MTVYVPPEFPAEDKVDRNVAMWRAWVGGKTCKDLAVEHGISSTRVWLITDKMTDRLTRRALGRTWHRLLNPPLGALQLSRPSGQRLVAPPPLWMDRALEGIWVESSIDVDRAEEVHRFYTDAYPKGRIVRLKG